LHVLRLHVLRLHVLLLLLRSWLVKRQVFDIVASECDVIVHLDARRNLNTVRSSTFRTERSHCARDTKIHHQSVFARALAISRRRDREPASSSPSPSLRLLPSPLLRARPRTIFERQRALQRIDAIQDPLVTNVRLGHEVNGGTYVGCVRHGVRARIGSTVRATASVVLSRVVDRV